MAVTLKDVAERAGVSRSAVSRAFTPGASVSLRMRQRVERAATELGYHPNALASSLTTGRTKMIGLVSNNFHNPFFLQVFDLFTRGLQDMGLRPLLVNLTDETDPQNSVRMLKAYSVDGVIVASSTLPAGFSRAFREAGVPVVHSFGRYAESPEVDIIGIDNVACGRMAAATLVDRGYASVAFLGGPEGATSTQDRLTGFSEEVGKHKEIHFTHSYAEAYTFEAGRTEMRRLLKSGPSQAYFCGDDVLSMGALSAISDSGLSVPDDVGIIGLNDMEFSRWECFDLTTIHQPIDHIIQASIDTVMAQLDDPNLAPKAKLFPCRLVERGTLRAGS